MSIKVCNYIHRWCREIDFCSVTHQCFEDFEKSFQFQRFKIKYRKNSIKYLWIVACSQWTKTLVPNTSNNGRNTINLIENWQNRQIAFDMYHWMSDRERYTRIWWSGSTCDLKYILYVYFFILLWFGNHWPQPNNSLVAER